MPDHDDRIDRYAKAAAAHHSATVTGASGRANDAHEVIAAIYAELREEDAREQLLPLLAHRDPGVRTWAAAHALEFAPEPGERALEEVAAQGSGIISFAAKQTLAAWRAGTLSFP